MNTTRGGFEPVATPNAYSLPAFPQANIVSLGELSLMTISGLVPYRQEDGNLIRMGGGTIEGEMDQIMAVADPILAAAGGERSHIMDATVIVTDPSLRGPLDEKWQQLFPEANVDGRQLPRPSRTTFVSGLLVPALVEAKFFAVIPKQK